MILLIKRVLLFTYFAVVALLSLLPKSGLPPVHLFQHADKVIHAAMYAGLAFLIFWNWSEFFSKRLKWLPLLIIVGLGTGIELLQEIPGIGRSFEWLDVLANTLGFIPGYGLHVLVKKRSR